GLRPDAAERRLHEGEALPRAARLVPHEERTLHARILHLGKGAEGDAMPLGLARGVHERVTQLHRRHAEAAHHERTDGALLDPETVTLREPHEARDREVRVGALERDE